MVEPIAAGWITTDEAQALTGYSVAYLRRLANRGDVEARKVGRDWLIWRESLLEYKARMDGLGREKHNPWRADLAEDGRGRGCENAGKDKTNGHTSTGGKEL
jgi:excisionase family DNA binding protein